MRISDWSSDVCSSDLGRAQALRLAAGRAAGAVTVVPRIHVHVRPLLRRGHEALQVQRGGDAAGHARGAAVGDVGDVAGQVAQVRPPQRHPPHRVAHARSEEHTSELQSLMRNSYAVFCLKKKKQMYNTKTNTY